jgi:hypothetical protein
MWLAIYFISFVTLVSLVAILAPAWLRDFIESLAKASLGFARRACAAVSQIADMMLQQRLSYHVDSAALLNWVALNLLAILLASIPFQARAVVVAFDALQICMALTNLILVSAFLFKAQQDDLRINSVKPPEGLFKDSPAVDDIRLLMTVVVLVVLHLTVIVQLADGYSPLLTSKPNTSVSFLDYLIVVSSALPLVNQVTTLSLLAAEQTTNQSIDVVFAKGAGRFVSGSIFFIGSFFLVGAVSLRYRQRKEIYGLVEVLRETVSEDVRKFALLKISRAPSFINSRLLDVAVTPTATGDQKHVIDLAFERKIHSFTLRLCYELGRQDNEIKEYGLDKARDAILSGSIVFDREMAKSTLVPVVKYANTWARGEGIRTKLYLVMLAILDRARGAVLSAKDLERWQSEPVLSQLPEMIVAAATRSARIRYDISGTAPHAISPQETAIRIGLAFEIVDLPLRFVQALRRSNDQNRASGLLEVRRFCESSDAFYADGRASALITAIDAIDYKISDRVRTALAELRKTVVRRSAILDGEPAPAQSLFARLAGSVLRIFRP